jgi:hypothetical protein
VRCRPALPDHADFIDLQRRLAQAENVDLSMKFTANDPWVDHVQGCTSDGRTRGGLGRRLGRRFRRCRVLWLRGIHNKGIVNRFGLIEGDQVVLGTTDVKAHSDDKHR